MQDYTPLRSPEYKNGHKKTGTKKHRFLNAQIILEIIYHSNHDSSQNHA